MSRSIPDAALPDRVDVLASAARKLKWHVLPLLVVPFNHGGDRLARAEVGAIEGGLTGLDLGGGRGGGFLARMPHREGPRPLAL